MCTNNSRPDFIFMLTRNDRTVSDAMQHLQTALDAGVRNFGFKDVGLPVSELALLTDRIHASGATAWLEVVSLDLASEIESVSAGIQLGVDHILGGVNPEAVLPLLAGHDIGYYPFAGQVHGHPSVLTGEIADVVQSAVRLARFPGVTGIDLLAWRHHGDVPALIEAVCDAISKPVIVAGSIDRPTQIATLQVMGAAGFTVGTSALDGRFPAPSPKLADQLDQIMNLI